MKRPFVVLGLLAFAACATRRPIAREDVVDEVWSTVRERFFDPTLGGLDWAAARARARLVLAGDRSPVGLSAAVNGMLAELGASHTALYTPEDPAYFVLAELFWAGLDPERRAKAFPDGPPRLPGIGLLTDEATVDGLRGVFVRGVLEGSPAAAAGIRLGDRLLAVEGEPFRPVASFRERVGRPTRLRLQRTPDPASMLELVVTPEALAPSELFLRALRASARMVERGGKRLGYAHLWSYAGEELQDTLRELLFAGELREADGLVLDLRAGFGGANPEYLNLFRADLPELEYVARDGSTRTLVSGWRKPVALLIDEGSTSGKEIFAHGFQRQHRGPVVGARSAGAVLGGSAFLMRDGSLLYLAVLDVRVDGERLEGRGVTPDIEVPFARPFAAGSDPQLERAFEALSSSL